ncbi:MAG: hypothetical protein ACO396_06605, partial [Phycisphaerales bacterium]
MTSWLAALAFVSSAIASPQRSPAPPPPASSNDVWSRLDHDRFIEALGSQGLGTTLEALERSEPSADPIESLRRRLAFARLPLGAADRDPETVAAAAAAAVALRDSLLEASGERHPLRGRRLADQVEEILLWILPSQGADLAVRFGVASPRQRAFIDRWLPLAEAYSAEAVEAHEIATERLEREFASRAGSLAPTEELLLRRLREERGRLAFLRGLALATSAELLASASDRQSMRRTAIELLEAERGNAPPDLDELARLALGQARSSLGEHALAQREFTALADDAAASSRASQQAALADRPTTFPRLSPRASGGGGAGAGHAGSAGAASEEVGASRRRGLRRALDEIAASRSRRAAAASGGGGGSGSANGRPDGAVRLRPVVGATFLAQG